MWRTVNKKIDFINSVEQNGLDNSMYFKINKFSRSRNSEVRNRIAQALNGTGDKEYIEILMRLMNDDDEIVRASACDSLAGTESRDAVDEMERHICDSSEIVREYVYSSLFETASLYPKDYKSEIHKLLLSAYEKEKSYRAKAVLSCALYGLGEKILTEEIKNYLHCEDCYVRKVVLEQLDDISDNTDISLLLPDLIELHGAETVNFVKSSFEKLIDKLQETKMGSGG